MQRVLQLIEYILCCFWKYSQRRNFADSVGTLMKWYRRDSKERTGNLGQNLLKLQKTLIQAKEHSRLEYETEAKERELWKLKSECVWFNSACSEMMNADCRPPQYDIVLVIC
jgi:hypothetical protein